MLYQQDQPPFVRRHPVLMAVAASTTVWWLWQGWYEPLALTGALLLLMVVSRRRKSAAVRDAGLLARAEYEHRLSVAGDPRGVFGRYPPAQPGWHPDPRNPALVRYFDGVAWTSHAMWR